MSTSCGGEMDQRQLSDDEAKALLKRAAELDSEGLQAQSLDLATVRQIAAEAGISPAAVDAALREGAERKDPVPVTLPGRRMMLLRAGFGLLLAYLIGAVLLRLFL